MKPADNSQQRRYVEWMLEQQAVDGNFSNKIFFFFFKLIEFTLGGYVNKQNSCIWDSEDPQIIEERPLNAEKVTNWCTLWSDGVFEPYFFENDGGMIVTVNSERYGHMKTDFIFACY